MSLFAVSLDELDHFGSLFNAVRGATGAERLASFDGGSARAWTWASESSYRQIPDKAANDLPHIKLVEVLQRIRRPNLLDDAIHALLFE